MPVTGVEPAPPPGGRLERLPVLDPADAGAREGLGLLPDDDHVRLPDHRRQAPERVQERAEVGRLHVVRQRVQAGAHRGVRGLEHAQQRLTRRAQQRRVGAVVELDLVRRLAQRGAGRGGGRDAQAWDGHGLTLAHASESRVAGFTGWIPVLASARFARDHRTAVVRALARPERGRAARARRARAHARPRGPSGVVRARAARDRRAWGRSAADGAWDLSARRRQARRRRSCSTAARRGSRRARRGILRADALGAGLAAGARARARGRDRAARGRAATSTASSRPHVPTATRRSALLRERPGAARPTSGT